MQAVGRGSWDGRGQVGDGELESEIWAEMGLGCDRHASVCGSAMWAGDGGGDVKVKVMACGRRAARYRTVDLRRVEFSTTAGANGQLEQLHRSWRPDQNSHGRDRHSVSVRAAASQPVPPRQGRLSKRRLLEQGQA